VAGVALSVRAGLPDQTKRVTILSVLTRAIVRPPATNFADGLTTAGLGQPDYERALTQHEAYCAALESCGLTLTRLDPDPNYPDSTFVEDVAILVNALPDGRAGAPVAAILTRPGAPSRIGEVETMHRTLSNFFEKVPEIEAPGTLDGGDICQAGDRFFIGVSERTNEAGASQLGEFLQQAGYASTLIDIRTSQPRAVAAESTMRSVPGAIATGSLLHLKSGIAYLGDYRLAIIESMAGRKEFIGYDLVLVDQAESYAANCIRVNNHVLIAEGYRNFAAKLRALGYQTIALDMSEFQKMDGGLSCLSLRF
jgi:dimethylargininase